MLKNWLEKILHRPEIRNIDIGEFMILKDAHFLTNLLISCIRKLNNETSMSKKSYCCKEFEWVRSHSHNESLLKMMKSKLVEGKKKENGEGFFTEKIFEDFDFIHSFRGDSRSSLNAEFPLIFEKTWFWLWDGERLLLQ